MAVGLTAAAPAAAGTGARPSRRGTCAGGAPAPPAIRPAALRPRPAVATSVAAGSGPGKRWAVVVRAAPTGSSGPGRAGPSSPGEASPGEASSGAASGSASTIPGPLARRVYHDSPTDLLFIRLCRAAYGRLAGWQSLKNYEGESYAGMVEVSRALMRGRTAQQQQQAVIGGFPTIPPWFRQLFPAVRWGAELNARITPAFFSWLVGPCAPAEGLYDGAPAMNVVKIEKCRYLEESNCVGMCSNLCRAPTMTFFTRELGMPLTMTPNFEDLSCEMIFGQKPPAPGEHDEVLAAARCLAACPSGRPEGPRCHALPVE